MNKQGSNPEERKVASGHIDDDVCVDLLNGFLSEAERDRVFGHVRSCAACERLLQERVTDRERLRALHPVPAAAEAEQSSGLGRLLQSLLSSLQLLTQKQGLAVGAAAVILVVALMVFPGFRDQPPGPFWLPMDATGLQLRDTGAGGDDQTFLEGLVAYGERDLAGAIEHLSGITLTGPDEMLRKVYLGSALAHSQEYEQAAELLETLDANLLPEPWAGETRWTLYTCWRELGRYEEADALLLKLRELDDGIGDRARSQRSR